MIAGDVNIYATARVKLTIEVPATRYQTTITAEDLLRVAGKEAVLACHHLFQGKPGWKVVGEPEVTLVTGRNIIT